MPIYVIHEHNATHLHWDFRLELGGVLKSWAVPKQPPLRRGIKRLAIAVQDHAKSYANFEGEIISGYGKGAVKIWDKGNFSIEKKQPKEIVINMQGKKLKGRYALIKTGYGKDKNYLGFDLVNILGR